MMMSMTKSVCVSLSQLGVGVGGGGVSTCRGPRGRPTETRGHRHRACRGRGRRRRDAAPGAYHSQPQTLSACTFVNKLSHVFVKGIPLFKFVFCRPEASISVHQFLSFSLFRLGSNPFLMLSLYSGAPHLFEAPHHLGGERLPG